MKEIKRKLNPEKKSETIQKKLQESRERASQSGTKDLPGKNNEQPDFGKFDKPVEEKKKRGRPKGSTNRKKQLALEPKEVDLIHKSLYGLIQAFSGIQIRVNEGAQELINQGWSKLAEEKNWNLEGVSAYGMLTIGYAAILTDNIVNIEKVEENEPGEEEKSDNTDTREKG